MKNIKISILFALLILLFCDFSRAQGKNTQTGVASYYASEFHGRRTASGEKYNMNALTAAHPSLPFDTYVRVTNLNNSKSVIVRINDRGPYSKKRIIDLSKAAAVKIGLVRAGVAKVKVEVVDPDKIRKKEEERQEQEPKEKEVTVSSSEKLKEGHIYNENKKIVSLKGYVIQLCSFRDEENALEKLNSLRSSHKNDFFCEMTKIKGKTVYRILAGSYKTKIEAQQEHQVLKKSGLKGFVREL